MFVDCRIDSINDLNLHLLRQLLGRVGFYSQKIGEKDFFLGMCVFWFEPWGKEDGPYEEYTPVWAKSGRQFR